MCGALVNSGIDTELSKLRAASTTHFMVVVLGRVSESRLQQIGPIENTSFPSVMES